MDVTNQILDQVRLMGSSDNTNPANIGFARCLNYAPGASITQSESAYITSVPWVIPFKDAVGLGADNYYVKFKFNVEEPRFACFEPAGWECARLSRSVYDPTSDYEESVIDPNSDLIIVNTYEPADTPDAQFYARNQPRLSVRVVNKGTGNIYVDRDFDVSLMQKSRRPIQEDTLWCSLNDEFYISFHARNTKRIPYDVDLIIGEQVINEEDIPSTGVLNEYY